MKSKFASVCKKCYKPIYLNDEIVKAKTFWKHIDCEAVASRKTSKREQIVRSGRRGIKFRTGR